MHPVFWICCAAGPVGCHEEVQHLALLSDGHAVVGPFRGEVVLIVAGAGVECHEDLEKHGERVSGTRTPLITRQIPKTLLDTLVQPS